MQYITHYQSPIGGILPAADNTGLNVYFSGREPSSLPPIHMIGTPFQLSVWKKISVVIPCHRVVGTNGSLTGYAGGIDKKVKLLALEKADMRTFFIPTKGTA